MSDNPPSRRETSRTLIEALGVAFGNLLEEVEAAGHALESQDFGEALVRIESVESSLRYFIAMSTLEAAGIDTTTLPKDPQ